MEPVLSCFPLRDVSPTRHTCITRRVKPFYSVSLGLSESMEKIMVMVHKTNNREITAIPYENIKPVLFNIVRHWLVMELNGFIRNIHVKYTAYGLKLISQNRRCGITQTARVQFLGIVVRTYLKLSGMIIIKLYCYSSRQLFIDVPEGTWMQKYSIVSQYILIQSTSWTDKSLRLQGFRKTYTDSKWQGGS